MIAVHVTWPLVVMLGLVFVVICFLAVLWSRREWQSRKIRVGVFLEREYRGEPEDPDEAPTGEWPQQK